MEISEQRRIFNEKIMPNIEEKFLSQEKPKVLFVGVHQDFDYSKNFSDKVAYETMDTDPAKKPTYVHDICKIDFLNIYDCIIFNGVYEYVKNPFTAIENCFAALKPGGIFVIGAPYKMGASGFWRVTPAGIKEILEVTGFEVLEVIPIGELENNIYTYAYGRKI